MATQREKALFDLRQQSLADARKIVDSAASENRTELTSEERANYDKYMGDWNGYNEAMEREQTLSQREADAEEMRSKFASGTGSQSPAGEPQDTFLSELWGAVQTNRRDAASWTLPGSEYISAPTMIGDYAVRSYDVRRRNAVAGRGEIRSLTAPREKRTDYPYTTSDASTTYSSYGVPTLVANTIEETAYAYSAVLQVGANEFVTEGINTMYLPKVSTNPTINLGTTQGSAATNSSYAVLGRTQLDGYRADAFVVITEEDIASSAPDMMAFIASNLAGAVAAKVAYYLAVGSGSSQPKGIFVAATTGKTAVGTTSFTGDEVIEAYQSVSAEYRGGLRAVISQAGESLLSRLKDGDGNYIWRQGLVAGMPDSLLGCQLGVDSQGPALTTGLKPLVFYNPRNFHVRWCMGGRTDFAVSTEAQFTQWNRVVRIARWFDCDAGDAGGCKSLTLA